MGMGVHLYNKLNRLAVVAEETSPDISKLTLRALKRIPFEGEDKDIYDALSKEFGVRVLLQKVKESRQKHNGKTTKVNLTIPSGKKLGLKMFLNPSEGEQYVGIKEVASQSIAHQMGVPIGKRIKRINGKGYGGCYKTACALLVDAIKSGNLILEIFCHYDV